MKFFVHRDPLRQRINVYCEIPADSDYDYGPGERVFLTRRNEEQYIAPMVHRVALGAEPPIWDWFPEEIATLLGEALAPRPEFSERYLNDAVTVRDRLLTVLEAQNLHGSGDPGTVHIQAEAEHRHMDADDRRRR